MMMQIDEIKARWIAFHEQKGYLQRLDPNHPMDFFIGINDKGHDELALFTTIEPAQLKSSDALEVEKNVRKDGRWATQISSVKRENQDIFARLCVDLVDSSEKSKSEQEGLDNVIRRFVAWQRLFANMHKDLPMSVMKGMVGELSFAMNAAEKGHSWEEILHAWQGPNGADRDYVFSDSWYEIKAISTGKDKVTISSLNQLEASTRGFLVVYRVDESSLTDSDAFSLKELIDNVRNCVKLVPEAHRLLEQKLVSLGYIDKKTYEDIYFTCKTVEYYSVDDEFPKIVTESVPSQIVGVRYDLAIAGIDKWKIDEDRIWN